MGVALDISTFSTFSFDNIADVGSWDYGPTISGLMDGLASVGRNFVACRNYRKIEILAFGTTPVSKLQFAPHLFVTAVDLQMLQKHVLVQRHAKTSGIKLIA